MSKRFKKFSALLLAGIMAFSSLSVMAATTDGTLGNSTAADNPSSVTRDMTNNDIIDSSKKGSITIHKYDLTAALGDGLTFERSTTDHDKGGTPSTMNGGAIDITSNGKENTAAETALAPYALKGVKFTYLRVGDVKTLNDTNKDGVNGDNIQLIYGIDAQLMGILGFAEDDAAIKEGTTCYFTATQINAALKGILEADEVDAKDKLEAYVASGTTMNETDANGETSASNLDLGLYLIVETEVPENVTSTVNPWFVQLPMTDIDGQEWFYDVECYPKNQTGHPTLDKKVRNAYGDAGVNYDSDGFTFSKGDTYGTAKIVTNGDDLTTGQEADWLTAANKNGDYEYGSTVSASENDVLDFILVSKIPEISSTATYLQQFEFIDTLSDGLKYNGDAKIAIYDSTKAAAAQVNDTKQAKIIWTADKFTAVSGDSGKTDGSTKLDVKLSAEGLTDVNTLYNDGGHYLVVYYTATVESNNTTVLGDTGNANDVSLVWKRTNQTYFNSLEDKSIVYSYGLDLTKTFADGAGDYTDVQFVLYNETEDYYVQATESSTKGLYFVDGKCTAKDTATVFSPDSTGKLVINGLEADAYELTEIATAKGYSLGQNQVRIVINPTTCDITPASVTQMTVAPDASVEHPDTDSTITLSDGTILTAKEEGTTDKTNMVVGTPTAATATVNETAANMCNYNAQLLGAADIQRGGDSTNAGVILSIVNHKGFTLPVTGGAGMIMLTLIGAAGLMIFGYFSFSKKEENTAC